MSVKEKENNYTCGTCKYYDSDLCYCEITGEFDLYEEDTCDGWTDDNEVEPTEEEKRDIIGDRKAHERMETEGRIE